MHNGMIDHLILNGRKQNQRAITIHFLSLSRDLLVRYKDCILKMYMPKIHLFLLLCFHKVSHLCMPKMAKKTLSFLEMIIMYHDQKSGFSLTDNLA